MDSKICRVAPTGLLGFEQSLFEAQFVQLVVKRED